MEIQGQIRSLIVWLLISSFFAGLSWAALIPMWQTPDEQAHFAQAQDYAAVGYRPNPGPSTSRDIVITEKLLDTFRDSGNNSFTYHPEYRIPYTKTTVGRDEEQIRTLPQSFRTDFVINEATGYPPLYYWYIAGVNKLFWKFDLITRVFVSRIATVFLTTAAVFVSYLLAAEVFKNRFNALVIASLVSFHPMWRFVGSGVTSDALMNLVYPLLILCFIRLWKRPAIRQLWKFLVVSVIALMVKVQTALVLFPFILLLLVKRNSSPSSKAYRFLTRGIAAAMIVFMVIAVLRDTPVLFRAPIFQLLGFRSIALPEIVPINKWKFSSPTIFEYLFVMSKEAYRQTFAWYWGVYRWLSLTLPLRVYRGVKIFLILSLFGWVKGLRFHTAGKIIIKAPLFITGASTLCYSVGILFWNYLFWRSKGFPIGLQGRYFFPNLPEHMIFVFAGLLLLVPVASRRFVAILSVTAMAIFHWYSLWFVSSSYYDLSNLQTFFLQASQYKPWFFKAPYLPVIILLGLISSGWFLRKISIRLK